MMFQGVRIVMAAHGRLGEGIEMMRDKWIFATMMLLLQFVYCSLIVVLQLLLCRRHSGANEQHTRAERWFLVLGGGEVHNIVLVQYHQKEAMAWLLQHDVWYKLLFGVCIFISNTRSCLAFSMVFLALDKTSSGHTYQYSFILLILIKPNSIN